jgi:histidyl-tRNA synthetase
VTAQKLQAPRGTFDVLPEQAGARGAVEATARRLFDAAGYRRIETPVFEATELFARGVGESTDIVQKEMYSFEDGSGRSLTLRPEGTAPVCRAYVEHGMHKLPQPVRLWYLSSFFRYERAQAGRYRQFWQVGVEAIGSDDPAVDAEAIVLLHALLQELDVRDVRLRVSSLGSPPARAAYRERLQGHLRAHADELSEDVRGRIDLNPLRAFDSDHAGTQAVVATAPRLLDELSDDDAEHFAAVRALLDAADVPYEVDPTLVRGLDYYTRTVFELTSDALGAQSGVGGGGRYDGLVELLGGRPTPGIGCGIGIDRLVLALVDGGTAAISEPAPVAVVVGADPEDTLTRLRIATDLRDAGIAARADLAVRKLGRQLEAAARDDAHFAVIVGDELAKGEVGLRDLPAGTQKLVDTGDLAREIGRAHGAHRHGATKA